MPSGRKERVFLALLRGINVGGHNKVPMAELRALCVELGWADVQSYIQSGNLVFRASGAASGLGADLEQAIERRFDLTVPVVVREAGQWAKISVTNPFLEATEAAPKFVMLALSKMRPSKDAEEALLERAGENEQVVQVGEAIWIHFGGGVGKSKLTPAVLDRMVGSPVTMRNWRTVEKLRELGRSL